MAGSLPGIQRRPRAVTGTAAGSAEGRDGVEPVVDAVASGVPVLITEQEVHFSTAAAVTVPSEKDTRAWVGSLRRLVTRSTADERAATRRHWPRRYSFLDQASMAREMDRL
ncbi:MAG: hypothetical protein WBZ37_11670 [Mycobacterium sp.]